MRFARIVLAFLFAISFSLYASAAFITVFADGGPFVTDSNIFMIIKAYDNNGAAKNNIDINSYVINNATGARSDVNYFGSVQGIAYRKLALSTAGDYNIVAVDLNDNVSSQVRVSVGSIKSVSVTFNPHNPPFNKTTGEDINFTLQGRSSAGADVNIMLRARLVSDANGSPASPTIDVNANGTDTNRFTTSGLTQGKYILDINNGLASFPVFVLKFAGFIDLQDDSNNSVNVFGAGKTVNIIAKAANVDGNTTQDISAISFSIRKPSGSTDTSITCDLNSFARCKYVLSGDANSGDYTVSATITVGSDTLIVKRTFSVQNYQMKFFAQTFSGGNQAIEKMPSVYPANSLVNFEAHFVRTTDSNELAGPDLNGTFCRDQNISVFIQKAGSADKNSIPDTTTFSSSNSNYCLVTINAPAVQGTYTVIAVAPAGTQLLSKSTTLNVQNFLIFLQAVASDTFDPNTPTGKFSFFRGEAVGFNPSYVDLNGQKPQIKRVSKIQIVQGSSLKTFTGATDANIGWYPDKNILILSSAAVSKLAGGFVPVQATVDVNTLTGDVNGVTAFGMFKLNVLSIAAALASDSNGTAKSNDFGPPSFGLDENMFIKVTVTTGNGGGTSGATVSLKSMRNVDTWKEIDATQVSSRVTDSNGIAVLNIGKLSQFGMTSGGYFTQVQVVTTDGNTDTANLFFESRRFMVFLQPLDTQSGSQCGFLQGNRRDQNASFIIKAFNPTQGFGSGDINVTAPSTLTRKVFFFGAPSKPIFPPTEVKNVSFDVNTAYPCLSFGGGGGQPSTKNSTMVKIYKNDGSNWATGMYNISLGVQANGGNFDGNTDMGRGFMKIQPFAFLVNPASFGQFGPPIGKPGATFDINVTVLGTASGSDVNVTATLTDARSGGKFEFSEGAQSSQTNIGIGLNRAGTSLDCNSGTNGCGQKGVMIKAGSTPSDVNTVRVLIPSTAKVSEYLITLTATVPSTGDSTDGMVFMKTQLYKLVNFGWFQNMYAVFGVSSVAPADWTTTGRIVEGANQYNPQFGGGGSNGPATLDFNFLVDYTNRRLVLDTNRAQMANRNSFENPLPNYDKNFSMGNGVSDQNRLIFPGGDINGQFRVIDISRAGGQEPGVKFIRKSALDFTGNQFSMSYLGVYPADTNFTVPIMVKNPDGTAADVNVIVTNIATFTPGSFFPQNLTSRSCSTAAELALCNIAGDFNSWVSRTDANGFALIPLKIAKPGSKFQLEITIYTCNADCSVITNQRFQPFEGPTIDIKKFTITTKVTGPRFTVTYNTDPATEGITLDVNSPNTPGRGALLNGARSSAIGVIRGISGGRNGVLGDVNADRNWYFVVLDGNRLLVDDDKNMTLLLGTSESATQDGGTSGNGAFPPLLCTYPTSDLNNACSGLTGNVMQSNAGSNTNIYFLMDASVDANAFDTNVAFFPVYTNPFNPSSAPNKDSNIQIALSIASLAGVADNTTSYSLSNVHLENFAQFQSTQLSPSSYSARTGTTMINMGNFSARTPGQYNLVFNLTIGSTTTEERVFFQVRS